MPDFLEISEISPADLRDILTLAGDMKAARPGSLRGAADRTRPMDGHIAALIFEKPSTRTRVSFDVAVRQLGGQPILLSGKEMHLGQSESVADTARVLSRFADIAMIRTFARATLTEFAEASDIPVINGLTNSSHPCQIMADVMTFEEHRGPVEGRRVVWIGAGTNVCNSLVEAAAGFAFNFTYSGPEELAPDASCLETARAAGVEARIEPDPAAAAAGADLIVTDAWTSMHDASDKFAERREMLLPYQVNERLMANTRPETLFMHCLPAHRGEEVTSPVLDGRQSVAFDEAENRLHVQKAILRWCLNV